MVRKIHKYSHTMETRSKINQVPMDDWTDDHLRDYITDVSVPYMLTTVVEISG